jgi:hypothetical protein
LTATSLLGLGVLLGTLNEPLDSLSAVPYARADLHKIWGLSKKSTTPDRRDRNLQKIGDLMLRQQRLKWIVLDCHS